MSTLVLTVMQEQLVVISKKAELGENLSKLK
jgi:hypothetical protein